MHSRQETFTGVEENVIGDGRKDADSPVGCDEKRSGLGIHAGASGKNHIGPEAPVSSDHLECRTKVPLFGPSAVAL